MTAVPVDVLRCPVGRTDERALEEARLRRQENGLPAWVRWIEPPGVVVALWVLRIVLW